MKILLQAKQRLLSGLGLKDLANAFVAKAGLEIRMIHQSEITSGYIKLEKPLDEKDIAKIQSMVHTGSRYYPKGNADYLIVESVLEVGKVIISIRCK